TAAKPAIIRQTIVKRRSIPLTPKPFRFPFSLANLATAPEPPLRASFMRRSKILMFRLLRHGALVPVRKGLMFPIIGMRDRVPRNFRISGREPMAQQTKPIELYYWPTPNGFKISIMLEELGVPYAVKYVNIGKGDQFQPDFLKIAPNNRMPAIIDPEGHGGEPISAFEFGA